MNPQISRWTRISLLVYTIYSLFYGLVHVISPELVGAVDPAIERVLGAAVLAFALGSGLAYLERNWHRVYMVILVQIAWTVLYTLTMVWGLLTGGIDPMAWAAAIIMAIFAILFILLYRREKGRQQSETIDAS